MSIKNIAQFYIELHDHDFVGRVYDLSIVAMYFDSYEEVSKYSDCKYAIDVNGSLTKLVQRVRSINLSGDMLWLEPTLDQFSSLPIAEYDWLIVAQDVFLMRYISVLDCALILANDIFELNQSPKKCIKSRLVKLGLPQSTVTLLEKVENGQEALRNERNARFHHGDERQMSSDDSAFRMASLFAKRGAGLQGKDRNSKEIDLTRYYNETSCIMREDFNMAVENLQKNLNDLLNHLEEEFENRFKPKFRDSDFPHKSVSRS